MRRIAHPLLTLVSCERIVNHPSRAATRLPGKTAKITGSSPMRFCFGMGLAQALGRLLLAFFLLEFLGQFGHQLGLEFGEHVVDDA
jgi:hypothetical protein